VILGDNIIEGHIASVAEAFRKQQQGAKILLKDVKNPQRFGVPILDGNRVVKIEENPANPRSSYAVTGMYFMTREYSTSSRRLSRLAGANLKLPTSIMPISRMEH
jgi:glucose-1-phosphate thymidylyltransferase